MSNPLTLSDTHSATSSPESADGPTQPDLLDGRTTGNCGPVHARASRSRSQASSAAPTMNGIYGPTSFASSQAIAPPQSWASRLQQRLARVGSTKFSLTWRASATPAKRPLFRLAASTRTIDVTDSGSPLPTPSGTSNHGKNHVAGRLD